MIIILLIILVLLTIIAFLLFPMCNEYFQSKKVTNIGNQIIMYLQYSIFKAIDKPPIYKYDYEIDGFPKYIVITQEEADEFRKFPDDVWKLYVTMWSYFAWPSHIQKYYMPFWKLSRNILRRLFDQVLPKKNITKPVIHFRCSDIPFNRQIDYHIPTDDMVQWTCDKIKEIGFNSIIMLHCNKHLTKKGNEIHCNRFLDHYANIYKKNNIQIEFQCNSILDDLAIMVHSPLLVSLNASSFAFIAGISKDPNTFISGNNIRELSNNYLETKNVDWIHYSKPPILHKDVPDYTKLFT